MSSIATAQSVHQKLLNIRDNTGEDFNRLLIRYGLERLLYRITASSHNQQFVLKGAMLFALWQDTPGRPTRDIDLLGFGDVTHKRIREVLEDICNASVPDDGLRFAADSIKTADIRDDQEYHGIRANLTAYLGNARVPIQIDIGVGDSLTPPPIDADYPALLNYPPPRIKAYHPATVVAEKFNAMVVLGIMNSRLKDFYDVYVILTEMEIDKAVLAAAITATFNKRNTPLPKTIPLAFTNEFASDTNKAVQWRAFLKRSGLEHFDIPFCEVVAFLKNNLWPIANEIGRQSLGGQT